MTALSANRVTRCREGKTFDFKVGANVHIYAGGLVQIVTATGLAEPADAIAAGVFAGVALAEVDNNPGSAGAKSCRISRKGTHLFLKDTPVQTDVGKEAYSVDDQTVAITGTTKVGKIVGLEGSTQVWVAIDNYC